MSVEYNIYWKTIIDTMADALMVVDPNGVIVAINRTMETVTGYNKNELIGQTCEKLCCDACSLEKEEKHEYFCSLFKDGKVARKRCSMKKKNGETVYVMKNASVLKNKDGDIMGGVETFTDLSEIVSKETVIKNLRNELNVQSGFHGIIGNSGVMRRLFDLITNAANSDAPVVIYGESGTGKELVASALHKLSPRNKGPLVKVNCAALNESLLESELFGHVRGSYTGAQQTRIGRFEAATSGSIFLDEIGDLPLYTQVKLLRVLQEKEIERVGDSRPIPIDVRIISATNKDLPELIKQGKFRNDLYYRIGVIPIHLPPLRQRREDIPLLINATINHVRLKTGKPITAMDKQALELMQNHSWPGNIRELINVIEHAFVLCREGSIMPEHLPPQVLENNKQTNGLLCRLQKPTMGSEKKQEILDALSEFRGNKSAAAKALGISRVAFYKRLKKYGIRIDRNISSD